MTGPIVHVVDDDDDARKATARLLGAVEPERASVPGLRNATDLERRAASSSTSSAGPERASLQTARWRVAPLPIVSHGHGAYGQRARIQRSAVDSPKPVDADVLLSAVGRALAQDAAQERARRQALRSGTSA
jgi:FixJ family two-component response regulator